MADFLTAYKHCMKIEGGYANHPNDTGGRTYKGIAQKKNPQWRGWSLIMMIVKKVGENAAAINAEAAKDRMLQQMVLDFYKAEHWDIFKLDELQDQRVATELFDTGVNMGTGRVGPWFQRVLNACNRNQHAYPDVKVDGIIGPKTIGTFNKLSDTDKYMVWKMLNCLQGARYIDICEHNPSQEVFMRSWFSRVFETI